MDTLHEEEEEEEECETKGMELQEEPIYEYDGGPRPLPFQEPQMMPVTYSMYDGWTGEEIEAKLKEEEAFNYDPNTHYEGQIEYLEDLICNCDFWPAAVDSFKTRQAQLAGQIVYTGRGHKHERRHIQSILKDCHRGIKTRRAAEDE